MKKSLICLAVFFLSVLLLSGCGMDEQIIPAEVEGSETGSAAMRLADHPVQLFSAEAYITAPPVLSQEMHVNKLKLSTTMTGILVSENLLLNSGLIVFQLEALWDDMMTGPVKGSFTITLPDGSSWKGLVQGQRHMTGESTWNWVGHYIGKGYGGSIDGLQILFTEEIETHEITPMVLSSTLNGKIINVQP